MGMAWAAHRTVVLRHQGCLFRAQGRLIMSLPAYRTLARLHRPLDRPRTVKDTQADMAQERMGWVVAWLATVVSMEEELPVLSSGAHHR